MESAHDLFGIDPHLQSHPLLWRLEDALRGSDTIPVRSPALDRMIYNTV